MSRTTGGGCCSSLNKCLGPSTTTPLQTVPPSTASLQEQIAHLGRELRRHMEIKAIYKAKLDRMQEYQRYWLHTVKENSLSDLISKFQQISPRTSADSFRKTSPMQLPATTWNPNLAAIADQAKQHGWYIEPNEIELCELVGRGSTADIYKGMWRGLDVAVKCIYPGFFQSNRNCQTWFGQELETLSHQRHPFVLRLMGACFDLPDKGWVVTEFLSRRTLKEWLHGQSERQRQRLIPLPPLEERIDKGLEIAQAMQYLHDQKPKVIHRDLKPSNVFLDDAMHVRVADFGHARFLREGELSLTGETGTYVYMAPEVIRCEPYSEKVDVYSFSIILNELITGQFPKIEYDYGPTEIALKVGETRLRPALPEKCSQLEELTDLILQSWDENPQNRPSFATITCSLRNIREKIVESVGG